MSLLGGLFESRAWRQSRCRREGDEELVFSLLSPVSRSSGLRRL